MSRHWLINSKHGFGQSSRPAPCGQPHPNEKRRYDRFPEPPSPAQFPSTTRTLSTPSLRVSLKEALHGSSPGPSLQRPPPLPPRTEAKKPELMGAVRRLHHLLRSSPPPPHQGCSPPATTTKAVVTGLQCGLAFADRIRCKGQSIGFKPGSHLRGLARFHLSFHTCTRTSPG